MTLDQEQQSLKEYLLGAPLAETLERSIEERLLTDNAFGEEIEVAEDELIDQYLRNELSPTDRTRFETYFLKTIERQQKFNITRTLNRYANTKAILHSTAPEKDATNAHPLRTRNIEDQVSRLPRRLSFWARWPKTAYAGFAVVVLILVAGMIIWRSYTRRSEVERGLLALNEAYREQRPGEGRITGLGYAPAPATRGDSSERFNYAARDRAERLLQDAANEQRSAASLHALGRLYLAERQYDKAIEQFEAALKLSPDDARLLNDVGTALMERGNSEPKGATEGKALADFARSLQQLNHALEIDPSLPDALFNRALLYQSMKMPRQASDDWRRYLQIDPNSPWAVEARRNLTLLEEQGSRRNGGDHTLQEFLNAYRAHNDDYAWQVISASREMITGRMIAFQLARSALQADAEGKRGEADELLEAMRYAGILERARANDPFVGELSTFYFSAGPVVRGHLVLAQADLNDGFRLCLVSRYDDARRQFERAHSLFADAGDNHEARVTDYWLAYCIGQRDGLSESAARLTDLAAFCRARSYRWLLSQALCQVANAYDLLGDHSRSLNLDRQALDIAVAIGDTYIQQKALTQLALQYTELGRPEHALDYHQRTLSASSASSPRQDWRNYTYTAQTLYALKRYAAAAAYEREALRLSRDELHDPALAHLSYTHLGMILAGTGRYDEAIRQASAGLDLARSLQHDSASRKMIAYSLLQLGHLTRQSGDCSAALQRYDESLRLYDGMEISKLDGYDAHKGRLLCYVNTGNESAVEVELPVVLEKFEQDRARIVEEQNRDSYFDAEQGVYDIAIAYAYRQGDKQRAFAYSEESRARSLLDMLTHGTGTIPAGAESEVTINGAATPQGLKELQGKLTNDIRVVQYAALKDKLLIWVISNSSFEVREQSLSADALNIQVSDYLSLLTRNDQSQSLELRARAEALYDLIVAPVRPLLEGAQEVCIVPDKALFHLPFAALVTPATGRYLVEDFTLFFAPSTTVLAICSRHAQDRLQLSQTETLLSVGNPAFDRTTYPTLPDLPAAEVEANEVAQIYGGMPALTGGRALKATFLELLPHANVVHFAGHYVADEHTPMGSRLLLTGNGNADDSLTAAEVYGKPLSQVRLVVLSACQTELERYDNGEGMIGIARTFLAAGAPLVVASQWPVDSDATSDLMVNFHRLRKLKALNTAAALCEAQRAMLAGSDEHYRNPYYWAAFLSVGGHTEY